MVRAVLCRSVMRARGDRTALAILGLGWLAFLIVSFPGQVTQDSIDQLQEARGSVLTDAHPPLMSFLWRYIDKVVPGTFGMLVLQTGLLVAGLYVVFQRRTRAPVAASLAIGLLWFPPISAPMMVIWKDSLMAGACMLGFALLLDERRSRQLGGLALITFGVALRYNGVALALPLVVLLFQWRPNLRARYALALGAWLAGVLVNVAIDEALTDRKMHYWSSTLAVMDVAGTLCYEHHHYSDAELEQLFAGTDLRVHEHIEQTMCTLFARTTMMRLVDPQEGMWTMATSGTVPTPESRRHAMARVWKQVVPSHPVAYLAYRASVFYRVLGVQAPPWGMVTPRVPAVAINHPDEMVALGVPTNGSAAQGAWIAACDGLATSTPLFRPWLYFALACVLLAVARRRDIIALLLGGIAMELSLLPLAVSPDYRYSHWLVLSTCVAAVLWILKVAERRSHGAMRNATSAASHL